MATAGKPRKRPTKVCARCGTVGLKAEMMYSKWTGDYFCKNGKHQGASVG